jgi:hypothetical protein
MSIAGAVYLEKRKKECGHIMEDEDIQVYDELGFKIKLETIPGSRNNARMIFLDLDDKKIPKPKLVSGEDISDPLIDPIPMVLFPDTNNVFLLEHLRKYRILYDNEVIYCVYSEKKFTIHNVYKPKNIIESVDQLKINN